MAGEPAVGARGGQLLAEPTRVTSPCGVCLANGDLGVLPDVEPLPVDIAISA